MAVRSYPARVHKVDEIRAASSTGGISIVDDAGTVGIFVEDATGSVGIAEIPASSTIETPPADDAAGTISVRSGSSSEYSKISMGTDANKATIGIPGGSDTFFTDTAAGDLVIRADDNNSKVHIGAGTSGIAGLVVSEVAAAGRVGIGVTSPTTALDVSGTITATAYAGDGSALTGIATGDITAVSLTGDAGGALNVTTGAAGFTVAGGTGLSTSGSGTTMTINGDDAAADGSTKGIATFASADFSASSGVISLADITTSHIASGTLDTDISSVSGSDDTLASAKAIKTYVDAQAGGAATFSVSEKVYMSLAYNSKIYSGALTNNTYAYRFQTVYTADIPDAGSTITITSYAYNGPRSMISYVPPVDCKLTGLAYSINMNNPENNSESLRIGVVKATFAQGSDGSETSPTGNGVWSGLGHATTYAMTGDPPAQLQKGTASFSSNNTITAGEGVGILFQSIGQDGASDGSNVGVVYGCVTLHFEAT